MSSSLNISSSSSNSSISSSYDDDNQNEDEREQSDSGYALDDDFFDDDEEYDDEETTAGRVSASRDDSVLQDDNDDGDDDDYDDDEEEDDASPASSKTRKNTDSLSIDFMETGKTSNDGEATIDPERHLFSSRRKGIGAKMGTNDAIKIISTPHGKVGILYQSSNQTNGGRNGASFKKTDPADGQNNSGDLKQRITPVYTADGKVALLYRGASSDFSKYEPIKNLTHFTDHQINKTESPVTSTSTEHTTLKPTTTSTSTSRSTTVQYGAALENEEENSILPNINRPLSEVLGIKKNQFIQFRITDRVPTATPSLSNSFELSTPPSNRLPDQINYEYDYGTNGGVESTDNDQRSQIMTPPRGEYGSAKIPIYDESNNPTDTTFADVLSKTEVVNLAIIPAFDDDLQAIHDHELRQALESSASAGASSNHHQHRRHHRHRPHGRQTLEDLSAIHCAMQAMVAIAAMATVFGMLGAYFKTRVLDQITIMHW